MGVIDGALRALALVASAVIVLSFVLFATEEVGNASGNQVEAVAPGPDAERARADRHTTAREVVDDANDVILRPFAGVAGGSDNAWARRGLPALIGLFVYGLGLAYLARLLDVRAHTIIRHPPIPASRPSADTKPPPGPA